jgi:hypothetical protein
VHVNGLGFTFRVNVNPILKFIHTLCKCKCIKFIYVRLSANVKYKMCKCKLCKYIL